MSVTMDGYRMSNPAQAQMDMSEFQEAHTLCPLCKRNAKWYYVFHEPTTELDSQFRCTLHPMNPIPGPSNYPDIRKVRQLY